MGRFFLDCLLYLFVRLWDFWACVGALILAGLFVWACPSINLEPRFRIAGTALQLLGLIVTAIGIQQTRHQFGLPGIFETLARLYRHRPRRHTAIVADTGAMGAKGASGSMGVAHVSTSPDSNVDQRLKRLEDLFLLMEQDVNKLDKRLHDEHAIRAQNDLAEKTAREAADADIKAQQKISATGGLRLSAVGLTWLMFGTILAGFSPEFAGFFKPVSEIGASHNVSPLQLNWSATVSCLYAITGLGFSLFYGLRALDIFSADTDAKPGKPAWRFHQQWLNFAGAATGWLCLWLVATKVWRHIASGSDPAFSWPYAGLALVAFVGITGFLPFTVVKLINSVGGLIEKIPGLSEPKNGNLS